MAVVDHELRHDFQVCSGDVRRDTCILKQCLTTMDSKMRELFWRIIYCVGSENVEDAPPVVAARRPSTLSFVMISGRVGALPVVSLEKMR